MSDGRIIHQAVFGRDQAWSEKQADVLMCQNRVVCVDGGRRFGKSYVGAGKFVIRVLSRMEELSREVRAGRRKRWSGIGKKPTEVDMEHPPDVECWVTAPRRKHLKGCQSYFMSYFRGRYSQFYHPTMRYRDGGREIWLLYNGVSARITFVVATSILNVISAGIDELWIDEAGLVENSIIDGLIPVLWEKNARIVATGTPSLGVEHYFTQWILMGLNPDHPFYQPDVVDPDQEYMTFIGSSGEAFLKTVRENAERDRKKLGASASQWIDGDWRLPNVFVYNEYDEKIHVVDYDYRTFKIGRKQLPRPSLILGIIDWNYSVTNPGACVIYHVWWKNHMDREDRVRPLVIAVRDHQEPIEYTVDGWYQKFSFYRQKYGIQRWYADPSRPQMFEHSKKFAKISGPIKPANKADKPGRINTVKALLHHDVSAETYPAFYIARECEHLPRQFSAYRRRLDADGNPTEQTIDYDDHCLDCCAFLVGMITRGGYSAPGFNV